MNKKFKHFKKTRFYLTIILISMLFACKSPTKDYNKAKDLNTIESFKEFIGSHPDHPLMDSAKRNIEKLRFIEAIHTDSLPVYKNFLIENANSIYCDSIQIFMQKLEYSKLVEDLNINKAILFINTYPESGFIDSINNRLAIEKNLKGIEIKAEILAQEVFDFDSESLHFRESITYSGVFGFSMSYDKWKKTDNLKLLKISIFNTSLSKQAIKINGENSITIRTQDGQAKVPLAISFKLPPQKKQAYMPYIEPHFGYFKIESGQIVYPVNRNDYVDFVCIYQGINKGEIIVLNNTFISFIE